MDKEGESQWEVTAFVKVTQSLSADAERKQKFYQAHLILIFKLVQSYSIFHWRHSAGVTPPSISKLQEFKKYYPLYTKSRKIILRGLKKTSKRENCKDLSQQKILSD